MPTTLGGDVVVVINPAQLSSFVNSENGPVVRDLLVRGERVKNRARQLCPVRTGNLRDHIVKRLGRQGGGVVCIVGVDGAQVPYAFFVHEGTVPHPIAPRSPTGRLVFFWERENRWFFGAPGQAVNHPGTKPNRFLLNALPAAAG